MPSSLVETFDDGAHVLGDAFHYLSRLHPRRNSVHFARHSQVVEALALLADGILGVDSSGLLVPLLQGLPHLRNKFRRM